MFKALLDVIRLSTKPATIIYPYPILLLLVFSQSETFNILSLAKALVFLFIFYSGVNLWNHVNDVEEDIFGGKKSIITENPKVRKLVSIISPLQYLISFYLAIIWIVDWRGIILLFTVSTLSWIYSDRIIFGKFAKRLKDHYLTEFLTFVVSFPLFTLVLWTFFSLISIKGIALSITMTFFMLSGTFLKDIGDITGDRLAGLKTLGVVFSPENLLKASFFMLLLYYVSIPIFILLRIFSPATVFPVSFCIGTIYAVKHFLSKEWDITGEATKIFKILFYSNIGSLLTFIVAGFM